MVLVAGLVVIDFRKQIMKYKLGIVGKGFVGNAVYEGMKHGFDVIAYDKMSGWSSTFENNVFTDNPYYDLLNVTDIIFVCVPTPMKADGSCDTSIVEEVVLNLNQVELNRNPIEKLVKPVVIIKSTVAPGTTAKLQTQCKSIDLCFNPEFLREATALEDFKNQDRIVMGGSHLACVTLSSVYEQTFPNVPIYCMDSTSAEMVKYTTNSFLAVKCSFANEIKQICDKLEIKYDEVIDIAKKDHRLGNSYWAVPGPDGLGPGFGGKCICKDLNALIFIAKKLVIDPKVMQASWEKNLEVRLDRDWERIPGVISK